VGLGVKVYENTRLKLAPWLCLALLALPVQAQTPQRTGPLEIQNALKEIASNGAAAQLAAQTNLGLGTLNTAAGLDARNALYAGGMKCDGTTDDTLAAQAAINAAQGVVGHTLIMPSGVCMVSGLTISNAINIRGGGRDVSIISLQTGSTSPVFSISVTKTAYTPTAGFPEVTFSYLTITSPSRIDPPGLTVAHGISLLHPANPASVAVLLDHIQIMGVPGDCVHSLAFSGAVSALESDCAYAGGYGLNINSAADGEWKGGSIYGAGNDNVLLSGTSNWRFTSVNFFVANGSNINLFNSSLVLVNCMVDLTGTYGININNPAGARVDIVGSTLRWASSSANATYSPLNLFGSNTGDVYLSGVSFPTPASSPNANKPLNNINFAAGNTGRAIAVNVNFDLGVATTAGVTNTVSSIISVAPNDQTVIRDQAVGRDQTVARDQTVTRNVLANGTVRIVNSAQFQGYSANNGTNDTFKLFGSTASNDNFVLQLLNGGSIRTQIGNGIGNWMLDGYSVGSSATPPASGLLVAGHRQFNGGTPPGLSTGASDCGTTPAIVGNDNTGRITVGSGTNGGHCSITFITPWTNPPICVVNNETAVARPVSSIGPLVNKVVITATSTLTAGDVLTYACQGYQ
jgi:hypothetical protein